jgi:tetratricopeptide (TPR) repeat protein
MKKIKTEMQNSPQMKASQAGEVHRIKSYFRSNAWIWIPAILVAAVTFVIFLPSLGYEFVNYDDDKFVYDNTNITSMSPDFFRWAFTNRQYQWSPLRWISHALDYKLWGINPAGHHFSSILLHSLNAFLVVILVAGLYEMRKRQTAPQLAEEDDREFRRKALLAGVITGLLFSIHPLRVESVAWVSERKDVLFAFFFLLSLISYLSYYRHRDPDNSQKKPVYYLLALVFFVMSVMSKAAAVTLPLVLVLLDFYPLKRIEFRSGPSVWRKVLVEKLPFFVIGGVVALINIGVHESMGVIVPTEKISFAMRALLAIKTFAFYLMKMIWPFDLTLIYGEPYKVSVSMPEAVGLVFFLAAVTALCIFLWHKGKRIWLAVWMYYIVMLLPVSVIKVFSTSFAHDRYTYMPSIGPFLLVGLGGALLIEKMKGKNKIIPVLLLIVVFSLFAGLTVKQSAVWKNSITLWNSVLDHTPDFVSGYFSRGTAYIMTGKYSEALKDLSHVISSIPVPHVESYNMRGVAYKETGDYNAALRDFSKVIELQPEYVAVYNNRADVYMRTGNYQKAEKDLNTAITLNPQYSITRINICSLNNVMGNFQQAIRECSTALEMSPDSSLAYKRRGFAYNALGRYKEAIYDYDKAVSLNSRDYETYHLRGIVYNNAGNPSIAIRDFTRAIELNPGFYDVYIVRGVTYGELGRLEDAIHDFTVAIGLRPKDASAYYNRGAALYQLGREKEAMKDFRKAAGLGDKTVQKILRERGIRY